MINLDILLFFSLVLVVGCGLLLTTYQKPKFTRIGNFVMVLGFLSLAVLLLVVNS